MDHSDANLLKGHLDLLLLATLERDPKYGGQIIADIQAQTNGHFTLREGSLYPALHRLEKHGWIAGTFQTLPRGGSPVKVYHLTPTGQHALRDKREQYERFSAAVRGILGGPA
ncbi:PadR family transcriptional regulator [Deinococcus maricopensis]|nr:PadR family transcriptional regulator [Deinococcus maricopensis]